MNTSTHDQAGRVTGNWKFCDGFSSVIYTISLSEQGVSVSVVDEDDGETPEIFDVRWDNEQMTLSFAVHWAHGRLCKHRILVGPNPDRIEATITSTRQELWERQ